jgi:glycerol uptake facilitator protein
MEVSLSRKMVAEFIGTAALVLCGPGTAAATFMFINGQKEGAPTAYAFDMAHLGVISFAFMMVIVAIIYAIGHISGCHINPAVTIALAAAKKCPWSDVPGYLAAQFAGAVAGALAIWGVLGDDGTKAGLGVLSYASGNTGHAFFAELIGTFLLIFVVFGTATDSRATPGWYGLAIPAVVFAVITVVGPTTGAALNPARYIGPMIARAMLPGGSDGLLWGQVPVYFGATILAGLIAAAIYAYVGSTTPAPVADRLEPKPVTV